MHGLDCHTCVPIYYYKPNKMKKALYFGCSMLLLLLSTLACKDDIEAIPFEEVRDIIATDDGNVGNGADVEINFSKQFNPEDIAVYRIFPVKSNKIASTDVIFLESLGTPFYTEVAPQRYFSNPRKKVVG